MKATPASYGLALGAVALVAWVSHAFLPVLGLASAALLFLLPVLLGAARGGLGAGLAAALAGAAAYNFLLLEPRYSFRVHAPDNVVSLIVLVLVALVTSRLATRLREREAEAVARAQASEEAARLAAVLAAGDPREALEAGVALVADHYGALRLLAGGETPDAAAFSSLDQSAAAWAMHNGDVTGHGTPVMPAADWSFIPLAPKARRDGPVAALARPADGTTRGAGEMAQIQILCGLLGQGWDRAALEDERREKERLAEADRLRRSFLASMAHDFRTPMTVIAGHLEALADQPPAREALAALHRLDRTMEDLVGAARIEEGSLAPRFESLDLVDVASAALEAVPEVEGIARSCFIPADLPFAHADPVLLHHILVNLIDNAQRHARGQVVLSASAQEGLRIMVEDDGAGIPPAERVRIFERFTRLEGSDRQRGSGLGLAIVKGFADAMQMTISIDDSPLGGARFTLAFAPVAP